MHRRHENLNIPIEIVRTLVAISETGSLSKAGERLGLSQPAVSSQIKRIQTLVGGSLFSKTPNGTKATDLGNLVLYQARRILEANDQLLRLGNAANSPHTVRVGLSMLFAEKFIKQQSAETMANVFLHADHSIVVGKELLDGYLDVACVLENSEIAPAIEEYIVEERYAPLSWVRSRSFVLSPGSPIPVLTWPGDEWMIRALRKNALSYKIVLNSSDYKTRLSAAEAGIGYTVVPTCLIPDTIIPAKDYYLPELPGAKMMLCARDDLSTKQTSVLKQLSNLFFEAR